MTEQLLILMVPATIRDELVDALISYEGISGFSLLEISGYSAEHSQYSLKEQVAGYRNLYRFEIQHSEAQETVLLSYLAKICRASHARYWIVAISKTGELGASL